MKTLSLLATAAVTLTLAACANPRDQRMVDGALIGGTGGAIIGGVASGTTGGAVVGGVAGAAAGAVIADATRPRHRGTSCHWNAQLQRKVCRYR